ncbi:protein KINESIN LIGHT CHAIN-RELATED 1 [Neltuma alba]|uniref:protein KINESIN LIGHT CHAIN-RELATED 1 n=1 Tax=Neltuma alba TaxID=207710 RepID=UPI0010A3F542|nr:protein KINESIN LIGHT CHAIN-RELATED 1 [Prosopis alba]
MTRVLGRFNTISRKLLDITMRKVSVTLLQHLSRRRLNPFAPTISFSSAPSTSSSPSPPINPSTHLKHYCTKSHGLLTRNKFQANSCRNMDTLVETPTQISSRQRKIKEKSELEEAFESAETSEDMFRIFKDMEATFDERELGLASLKIGLKLDQEGEDPEKALSFADRALKALDSDNKPSILVAMTLQLMGSANYSLKRFSDSLGYLNRANRILGRLQGENDVDDVRPILHAVQLELANVKTAMGRREEALENLRKCLEIKQLSLEEDSRELGKANRDLAEAYVAVLNFKEALPFCMQALEIHKKQLGNNSVEVAHDRRILGVIYSGLEEHEKALEQNTLSKKILTNWNLNSDLLRAEIDAANMLIALGRYDEATGTLRSVVQQTDADSETRALVLISMAKALCNQDKFADSKRCLEIACGILDKKESISPVEVAEAYSEISMQYEAMNEFETAISLLKRSLALLEKLPQEQHSEGSISARIGWLLLLTGKVQQAIPYLESAAETLKDSFGPKHFGVGYIYNNLGAAYLELARPQSAAQMFAVAKDIMDVSLGPHHADTIEACQNLSKAYGEMGSYGLAIEFQQQAIDAWESHGAGAADELREARRLLEQLKQKASSAASANEFPAKALPLPDTPQPPTVSQPNISLQSSSRAY